MSRIDEALRRSSDGRTGSVRPPQAHFVSAWTENEAGPAAHPRHHSSLAVVETARTDSRDEPQSSAVAEILVNDPGPMLPALDIAYGERLASSRDCDPALVEQFRRLGGTLHKMQLADGLRLLMVTSAVPSDGKTLTALNLALVLSGSYKRKVLLIDADLRRPSVARLAGLEGTRGLSEVLKAPAETKLGLIPLTPNLTLLPSGSPDPDPIAGLTSSRMRKILDEAIAKFDWVIIDAPPVAPLTDAHLLAEMVDGTLFVVRAGQTQYAAVESALNALGRDRILGVVLNGLEQTDSPEYAGYYYASSHVGSDEAIRS